jgi:hypothetical protein
MKKIMRSTCLALFCVGTAWVGYEITLQFGSAVIFLFAAFALAAPSGALFSAPEGYERSDGFHVRAPNGRCGLVSRLRLLQRQVRREWTSHSKGRAAIRARHETF